MSRHILSPGGAAVAEVADAGGAVGGGLGLLGLEGAQAELGHEHQLLSVEAALDAGGGAVKAGRGDKLVAGGKGGDSLRVKRI